MRTAAALASGYAIAYQSSPSKRLCFRNNVKLDRRPKRAFRSLSDGPVDSIGASTDDLIRIHSQR
jgi:hypothetical protein